MYRYKLQLDILSLAPQLEKSEFKVNKKTLKKPGHGIYRQDASKCMLEIFPILSLVQVKKINVRDIVHRQVIEIEVKSLRKHSKDLKISGINPHFFDFKVIDLDA